MPKPIQVDPQNFEAVERYNGGYDVSVMTPSGDMVNVYIDPEGVTHVVLQDANTNSRDERRIF